MLFNTNAGNRALRRGRYSQDNARYFITICTNQRRRILYNEDIPEKLFDCLLKQEDKFDLVGSVVMPDHLHFIIRLKDPSLEECIRNFKGRSSYEINRFLNEKGSLWQRGYFDHKFRRDEDLGPILNYMWNNPKKPGHYFRCNKDDWLWFKSLVTKDLDYPVWLKENPMG